MLGLPVDGLTMAQAVALVKEHLQQRRVKIAQENAPAATKYHIVTINPEIAWNAENDPAMKRAIREAALVIPDGSGIVLAAKLKGKSIPERVAGFDLMQNLLALAATEGLRVFLLGAAPGVAEAAAAVASERYPGLQIVGINDGYFADLDEVALLKRIAALDVDMLFCALGPPRPAELWINRHLDKLRVGLAMGVGGSFDVMAGVTTRAPLWMQKSGLEWLHRVLLQPKRIKRLAAIPKFLWRALREE